MDSKTQIKFTFSGHESFQCRHLWLKKGYDFVNKKKSFNNDDAVVELGVGKNMVSSIRFWMKAFNLLTPADELTDFAHKLLSDEQARSAIRCNLFYPRTMQALKKDFRYYA